MFYDIFYHSLEAYFFPHENDRGHHFGDWVHRYSSSWFYLWWHHCFRGRHRQVPPVFWCLPLFIWAISRKLLQKVTIKLLSRLHKHQNYGAQEAWEAYEGRTNRIDWWKCQLLPMEKNINLKKIPLLINDNHSWQKYKKLRKISILIWKSTLKTNSDLPHRQFMLNRRAFTAI